MGIMEKPEVTKLPDGSKYWEHRYESFYAKVFIPANVLNGAVNDYSYEAPFLVVMEEKQETIDEAIDFARTSGLSDIAAQYDSSVVFVYPTCDGGWKNADVSLYQELIAETRMNPMYADGMCELHNFFTKQFDGYFIRGAIFRADLYGFGESADYIARNLLKTVNGQYLWGPGEITPSMCSMERLSVLPSPERTDIGILSVGNSEEVNKALGSCNHLLIKDKADYKADYKAFVRKFKMWVNKVEIDADLESMNMVEEPGWAEVKTAPDHRGRYKDQPTHTAGYFAYYNKGLLEKGPVPLMLGFHGGGDSSMYLTYVSGWYQVAHKYNFLYIAFDDHLSLCATEVMEALESIKQKYNIDEKRIYATGFSMGSGKTWDMYQEYPDVFAGLAPCSALFPMKDNKFGLSIDDDRINKTVPVPVFYSGGELSPLPELPFQDETCLDRVKYCAKVNKLCKSFDDLSFEDKDKWEDRIYGIPGDRVEKLHDEARDAYLTVNYYDSEDGICRTAFASVSNQQHECRMHSCEAAWNFISKFSLL